MSKFGTLLSTTFLGRRAGVSLPPPLSAGAKGITIGDSIIQFGNQALANDIRNDADSELHWAMWRIGHRIRHHVWEDLTNATGESPDRVSTYGITNRTATGNILFSGANLGYAGDIASGALLRLTAARNIAPDIVIYAAGTNAGSAEYTPVAVTVQAISDFVTGVKAGFPDRRIIVATCRPRRVSLTPTGTEISTTLRDRLLEINTWIRNNASVLGYTVWDAWEDLRDPAYNPGDALYGTDLAGVTRDNVHLTPIGAWKSSASLATAIASIVGPGSWFSTDMSVGNLLANPLMTGTTGTANNGASGTLPANCFLSNVSGAGQPVTAVCSVEANADTGGQSIVVDFTSTGAGAANVTNVFNLSFTNPTTGFTSTDYVSAAFEVEVGAASAATLRPGFQATIGQGSTLSARGLGQVVNLTAYNGQPFPDESLGTGWVVTEPMPCGAKTGLNPRFQFCIRADVAGTVRFKIKRRKLFIVSSPVTAFPWTPV